MITITRVVELQKEWRREKSRPDLRNRPSPFYSYPSISPRTITEGLVTSDARRYLIYCEPRMNVPLCVKFFIHVFNKHYTIQAHREHNATQKNRTVVERQSAVQPLVDGLKLAWKWCMGGNNVSRASAIWLSCAFVTVDAFLKIIIK